MSQPVGNPAVNEALHDKGQRRDAVHRAAFEGTDIPAVKQVDGKAVLAEVADEAVCGMATDIGHAKTLCHAGVNASVQGGKMFHDCTPVRHKLEVPFPVAIIIIAHHAHFVKRFQTLSTFYSWCISIPNCQRRTAFRYLPRSAVW